MEWWGRWKNGLLGIFTFYLLGFNLDSLSPLNHINLQLSSGQVGSSKLSSSVGSTISWSSLCCHQCAHHPCHNLCGHCLTFAITITITNTCFSYKHSDYHRRLDSNNISFCCKYFLVSCSIRVPLKPPARSASAFPAWTCLEEKYCQCLLFRRGIFNVLSRREIVLSCLEEIYCQCLCSSLIKRLLVPRPPFRKGIKDGWAYDNT